MVLKLRGAGDVKSGAEPCHVTSHLTSFLDDPICSFDHTHHADTILDVQFYYSWTVRIYKEVWNDKYVVLHISLEAAPKLASVSNISTLFLIPFLRTIF